MREVRGMHGRVPAFRHEAARAGRHAREDSAIAGMGEWRGDSGADGSRRAQFLSWLPGLQGGMSERFGYHAGEPAWAPFIGAEFPTEDRRLDIELVPAAFEWEKGFPRLAEQRLIWNGPGFWKSKRSKTEKGRLKRICSKRRGIS